MTSRRRARAPAEIPAPPRAEVLALVDARLVAVKHRISLAALSCLRGAIDAPVLVRQALSEVERARGLLAQAEVDD